MLKIKRQKYKSYLQQEVSSHITQHSSAIILTFPV